MKLSTSKQTYVYKLFYVSLIVNTTQKSTVDSRKMYLQMFCGSLYSRKAYSRFTKIREGSQSMSLLKIINSQRKAAGEEGVNRRTTK